MFNLLVFLGSKHSVFDLQGFYRIKGVSLFLILSVFIVWNNWLFYRFTRVFNIITKVLVSYPVKGYSIDFHFTPSTGHNIAKSKKAAVLLSLARKEQTRAAFAELKPLLACCRSADSLLVWYRKIWYPKLEFGEMNICQTNKTHHRTETKWGRPIFDLLMKWPRQGCRPRRWWNNTIHVIGGLPFDFAFYGMAAIISTIGVCVRHKKHGHRDWGHQMFAKYSKNFTSTSKNIFSKKL